VCATATQRVLRASAPWSGGGEVVRWVYALVGICASSVVLIVAQVQADMHCRCHAAARCTLCPGLQRHAVVRRHAGSAGTWPHGLLQPAPRRATRQQWPAPDAADLPAQYHVQRSPCSACGPPTSRLSGTLNSRTLSMAWPRLASISSSFSACGAAGHMGRLRL
jgi:hypothetical protein